MPVKDLKLYFDLFGEPFDQDLKGLVAATLNKSFVASSTLDKVKRAEADYLTQKLYLTAKFKRFKKETENLEDFHIELSNLINESFFTNLDEDEYPLLHDYLSDVFTQKGFDDAIKAMVNLRNVHISYKDEKAMSDKVNVENLDNSVGTRTVILNSFNLDEEMGLVSSKNNLGYKTSEDRKFLDLDSIKVTILDSLSEEKKREMKYYHFNYIARAPMTKDSGKQDLNIRATIYGTKDSRSPKKQDDFDIDNPKKSGFKLAYVGIVDEERKEYVYYHPGKKAIAYFETSEDKTNSFVEGPIIFMPAKKTKYDENGNPNGFETTIARFNRAYLTSNYMERLVPADWPGLTMNCPINMVSSNDRKGAINFSKREADNFFSFRTLQKLASSPETIELLGPNNKELLNLIADKFPVPQADTTDKSLIKEPKDKNK